MKIFGPEDKFIRKTDSKKTGSAGVNAAKNASAAKAYAANESSNSEQASASVKVGLSAKAKEIAKARDAAAASPDVRTERVSEIKRQVEDGSYNVSSDKIAGKIIQDIINGY